jgi:hypothetical protein
MSRTNSRKGEQYIERMQDIQNRIQRLALRSGQGEIHGHFYSSVTIIDNTGSVAIYFNLPLSLGGGTGIIKSKYDGIFVIGTFYHPDFERTKVDVEKVVLEKEKSLDFLTDPDRELILANLEVVFANCPTI